MTNNNSDSDHNLHILPNQIVPIYNPNQNLQLALSPSSYNHSLKRKRTKTTTIASSSSTSSPKKPKHTTKKPDPNAPKITRPCTECGKQFWSLKALFGHMRCHPERQWRGINPPPKYRTTSSSSNWVSSISQEDHEVASCLLMLSNATTPPSTNERFECGGCKKVFGSHQALGGHRASHKNVKGCFAIKNDDMVASTSSDHVQGKIVTNYNSGHHKCNVCFRVFSSGQALGGHMRCHWEKEDGGFDLNVPARVDDDHDDDFSTLDTSGCSLDLRLKL